MGGSHGKIDANSFLKAKKMKIIFTAPQLFCGFFQTKPAVQITLAADQGCGITLLLLAVCFGRDEPLLSLTACCPLPISLPFPPAPQVCWRGWAALPQPPQLPVSTSQHKRHVGEENPRQGTDTSPDTALQGAAAKPRTTGLTDGLTAALIPVIFL